MVSLSHPKIPVSLHIFSSPTTSSSFLTTPMKLKTLRRVIRAFSKAKSLFLELFRDNHLMCLKPAQKRDKYMKKLRFGSFRLHYNWCSSSHAMPFPSPIMEGIDVQISSHSSSTIYYDSRWNSVFSTDDDLHHDHDHQQQDHNDKKGGDFLFGKEEDEEGGLSSYLQWLEEKGGKLENSNNGEGNIGNEIDKLADMFIASVHEKFRLEIESYRRYQEMLAIHHDHDHQQQDHNDKKGGDFFFVKEEDEEGQLSSYLQWLEEEGGKLENSNNGEGNIGNEIDKLADMFIASCYEKFRLEKIESYRRYQEMLDRSM